MHGFVTTDFIESAFGYSDAAIQTGGGGDCVSQVGSIMGGMNGLFASRRQQLAAHIKARIKAHKGRMTAEEKEKFLAEDPLLGISVLPRHIKIKAFQAARKRAHPSYLERKEKRRLADEHSLSNREKEMKAEERRNAVALAKFKANMNHPCYHSMEELQEELRSTHAPPSTQPKYSDLMKCEIVADQLRYRQTCLARVLRPGAMHSNHRGGAALKLILLLESFAEVLEDERETPSLLNPPEIRKTYQGHQFATNLRLDLDRSRNAKTKEMTDEFMATHPDGVFEGHRCTVDFSRGNSSNPEDLIGMRVGKMYCPMDEPDGELLEFLGTVTKYDKTRKWWQVLFDDGEKIEFNFRELCAFSTPPDFSVLTPVTPDAEAAQLKAASKGAATATMPAPSDTTNLTTFTLEAEDYAFISVFFETTTSPFVGAYILQSAFVENLRLMSHEDLLLEAGVHFTPMPKLHEWIAASKGDAASVPSSDARERRRARRAATATS